MKEKLKKVFEWFQDLMLTFVSIVSTFIFSKISAAYKVKHLFEASRRSTCVILGNGPSLKDYLTNHFDDLSKYDLLCVNQFCTNKCFKFLKPKYYVLTDPAYFDPGFNSPRINSIREELFIGLKEANWDIILFVPAKVSRSSLLNELRDSSYIHLCPYNTTALLGFKRIRNLMLKQNLGIPRSNNVLAASILLMINIGYQDIYLLGADHNWLGNFYVSDDNKIVLGDKHFYGENEVIINSTFSSWLMTQYIAFKGHEELECYAKYRGVHVYNATEGSFIDAYEKKHIE